ncbi:zinc ribbon domain-containing protein [Streptomyces sp. NPDC006368]|uniref:zinc ribbon domain-containing protein n=1 Tax=Streptomyces sp. NPDC006368 TaxID=3156760 RepID=UPI0033BB615E
MPTAIAVTSADLVLPPTDQQTPAAAVLPAPDSRPLDAALADMQMLLEQHGHVVVAYPSSVTTDHERRLFAVRAILESDRVALLKLDLPPLGTAVLVRQLRQLSLCDFSPGIIASAARLLSHYIYAGAVLNSVAKLDRVPVSLKAHLKGWMPGSQFAVLAGPQPQLIRIGQGSGLLTGPEFGAQFGTRMLTARGALPSEWVTDTLAPAWHVQDVQEAPLPDQSPRWWGTGKLVEFAAYLPDITVLYQLVASVRRERCHWCGMELIGDRCAFCSAPVPAPENRAHDSGVLNQGTSPNP